MAKQKIRNPFIHSHDHDHDHHGHEHRHGYRGHEPQGDGHHHHDHDLEPFEVTDPAQQSLADALRVSFNVLKVLMVLLFVAYLFTGIFRVTPQERAIRLQFGKVVGDTAGYDQGWHFGLPYPIEQKIMVPVVRRTVSLPNAFWFQAPPGSEGQTLDQMRGGPLNPERDGSLITADANVVHGRFQVEYVITDPARYVQNVGELALADQIVRNAAEQGIVYAIAQSEADAVIRRQVAAGIAARRTQQVLDDLQTGILIIEQGFLMTDSTMPLPVRPAYQAVINAQSERARLIEEARQQRTSILNDAAGEAHEPLFDLLLEYELALDAGDAARADELSNQIDQAFDALRVASPQGVPLAIGGQAATIINQAQTDRVQTVEQVKAEANSFLTLLARYRENPQLVRTQIWQNARQEIFSSDDVETIYADTTGTLTIHTNRDPNIARRREQEQLRRERESVRQNPQR